MKNQEIEYIQNLIVIYSLKYKDYQICRRERKAETSLSQTESRYDGFHVVYTNLDDEPGEIVKIIQVHWEIEEFFQIMCPEFKSKDFFSKKSFQLKAHFITSFIALLIYRIAQNRLTKYPFHGDLLSTLKNMNVTALGNDGYVPSYTRTEFTDILHEMAGFRTDSSLTTQRSMREICRKFKKTIKTKRSKLLPAAPLQALFECPSSRASLLSSSRSSQACLNFTYNPNYLRW